jgi:hypothetical protein
MTMALACATSAAALAAAALAAAGPAAASSGTSGGTPGGRPARCWYGRSRGRATSGGWRRRCPGRSAGDCAAVGYYAPAVVQTRPFVVTSKNGSRGPAIAPAGIAALDTGHASQHNGAWGVAGTVSQLVNLNVGNVSDVTGLSCASVGSCRIVGYYHAGPDDQQPFVAKGSIAVPTSAALTLSTPAVVDSREQSERFSVTTKAANGLPPTGTVAIRAGSTTVCAMTLSDGVGSGRPAASKLKPGTYSLVANLGPTQIYMSATSPAKILKVKK